MMDWISVIALILMGIAIILVEIIFVPGTTVVGILGFLCAGYGVYLGYGYFGSTQGSIVLGVSAALGITLTFYAFKSKAWERFSLKGEIDSKVNEGLISQLTEGSEGVTTSSLKPIGKASFNDLEIEVRSNGGYIAEQTKIRILKMETDRIIVEPI